ncbi:MAG TPA: Holliday junction resolvase RuvX [Acidimicrobiia bacterium]|nr:Holliday junction resolvase RuvX [Acidimicrobiia bacterium]
MTDDGRAGRVLGLDYGSRRVGVAVSDPLRITAGALEVVDRERAVTRVTELVDELEVTRIVLGFPRSLAGGEGPAAAAVRRFAAEIEAATGLSVTLVDERFSTVSAERSMREAGARRRTRRESLDKVAAAIILQGFLDHPQ